MDATIRSDEDRRAAGLCPVDLFVDMLESFTESSRSFAEDLNVSSVPSALSRTISSTLEANGSLFEQLSDFARQFGARGSRTDGTTAPAAAAAERRETVVLRGRPGTEAEGAFLLENLLREPTRATVLATEFADDAGARVPVDIRFEPDSAVLGSGEEIVVRVVATIPDPAPPGSLYGAIHVPGVTASTVAVVIQAD